MPLEVPKPRGFACIGLENPKKAENIGGVLRAAHCYEAPYVVIKSRHHDNNVVVRKGIQHSMNTPQGHRHFPVICVEDILEFVPVGAAIVAVEITPDAVPLMDFKHPEQAFYVFGPEDGSVSKPVLEQVHHQVYVPTRNCMNLASTVNVVLYDRLAKSVRKAGGDGA